ncbi:MAG: ABC transporter substrate-binding protein [Dehalococcoidia bacterium]
MFPVDADSRRRLLLAGAALLVIVVAIGAYLRISGDDDALPVEEGALVEGLAGTWQRVNPLFANLNEVDEDISALVFAGLLVRTPDGSVAAGMADLPEISADGRTYTFRLRDGLLWHDGQPVTSADVAFTIDAITDPEFRGDPALAEPWTGIEVQTPDERTVVFVLQQPLASFEARYATIGIVPEHVLGELTAAALFESAFNQEPIGSGPYRLTRLGTGEALLEAFPQYYQGKALIERIRLRFFPDYPSATAALAAGELDAVMLREPLTASRLAELQSIEGIDLLAYQRSAYLILYLNNDDARFSDPRVRRAISLAIDRRALAADHFAGVATASASVIAPGTWAYAGLFDDGVRSLTEARRLLDEAGWTINAATGVRTREGSELRFTIRTDNDAQRTGMATAIAESLDVLGIRATVAATTFLVLQRDFLRERRYDAALAGWDQGGDPDPYFGWHSSQLGTAGLNLANFRDVVSDELIATARQSTDQEVRRELYRQFQEQWAKLAPSVVLLYPQYLYAVRGGLEGPEAGALAVPADRFAQIHTWKQ